MNLRQGVEGKRILFFSIQTFRLEQEITNKLTENGAIVTYFDERPSNSNFTKGIIRLKRKIYQQRIDEYYSKILKQIEHESFDYLFVNRGEVITATFLEQFKKINPQCELIYFTWDSFSNHGHPTTILKYFDKRFTFDREDAVKFNIGFRPLFFLDKFQNISKTDSVEYVYDLLFIGTAHSDRYVISNKLVSWCKMNNLTFFTYYFIHSRAVFFFKKIFDQSFKQFEYKKMSFNSLSSEQIIDLYKKSKVVLDINHPGQKGLTMRTFEAIGARKKVITTNAEIKRYPFYSPQNFFIIDRDNIKIDLDFFVSDYYPIPEALYKKCSMEGWLSDLFLKPESEDWKTLVG
ncbi:hypothetical protein ABDK00_008315 [Niabella insulamsoli]|uniref:hypothetical protein n=1 Tax=Niabella insulamsoli TaxID=3144874 RepID=UPI0031FC51FA